MSQPTAHVVEFSSNSDGPTSLTPESRTTFDRLNSSSAYLAKLTFDEPKSHFSNLNVVCLMYSDHTSHMFPRSFKLNPLLRTFAIMPGDYIIKVDCYTDIATTRVTNLIFHTFLGIVFSSRQFHFDPTKHNLVRYSFQNRYKQFYALQSIMVKAENTFCFAFRDQIPCLVPPSITVSLANTPALPTPSTTTSTTTTKESTINAESETLTSVFNGLLPTPPFVISPTLDSFGIKTNPATISPQLQIPTHILDHQNQYTLKPLSTLALTIQPNPPQFEIPFEPMVNAQQLHFSQYINGTLHYGDHPSSSSKSSAPKPNLNDPSIMDCNTGTAENILTNYARHFPNYIILGVKYDHVGEISSQMNQNNVPIKPLVMEAPPPPSLISQSSNLLPPLKKPPPQVESKPRPSYMQVDIDFNLPSQTTTSTAISQSFRKHDQFSYPRISAIGFQYVNHRTNPSTPSSFITTIPLIPSTQEQFFSAEQSDKIEIIPIPQSFIGSTVYPQKLTTFLGQHSASSPASDIHRHRTERICGMLVWAGKYINGIQFIYTPSQLITSDATSFIKTTMPFQMEKAVLSPVYGTDIGTCRVVLYPPDLELAGMTGQYCKRSNFITNMLPHFDWRPIPYDKFPRSLQVLVKFPTWTGKPKPPGWFECLPDLPLKPTTSSILRLNAKFAYITADLYPYLLQAPLGPCAIKVGINPDLFEVQYLTFIYHNAPPIRFGASPNIFHEVYQEMDPLTKLPTPTTATTSIPTTTTITTTTATTTTTTTTTSPATDKEDLLARDSTNRNTTRDSANITRESAKEINIALTQSAHSSIVHHFFKFQPHHHLVGMRSQYLIREGQPTPFLCSVAFSTRDKFDTSSTLVWSSKFGATPESSDTSSVCFSKMSWVTKETEFSKIAIGAEAVVSATRLEHLNLCYAVPIQSSSMISLKGATDPYPPSNKEVTTAQEFLAKYPQTTL